MHATSVLRRFGVSVLFAFLIAWRTLPASEQALPSQDGSPVKVKVRAARDLKRKAIPLQGLLQLARESNNKFRTAEESAFQGLTELRLSTGQFTSKDASLQSALGQRVPQTLELLCYNQQPVGPTIRVRPGTTFRIRLKNEWKGNPDPDPMGNQPGDLGATFEKPHGLCTTNLHTHGLHVSPADDADNIFRLIEPNCEFTYQYTIPENHPSGTFWYHAHKHGSVAYQLSNGLAGALIVERKKKKEKIQRSELARYLEHVPEIAAAEEKILVLQLYNYRVGADTIGRIDAQTVYNIQPDSKSCEAINISAQDPAIGQATAINGVIVPTITIAPGEVQRWRIIHGSWDELKPLTFADKDDNLTTDLLFREIAVDGLATGGMVLPDQNTIELAPGQRSDVLIQAPMIPKGQEAIYFLKQKDVPAANSLRGQGSDPLFLAKIRVCGDPKPMSLPNPKALFHCRALDSIRDYELSPPPKEFQDGILLNGYDKDTTYTINGKTFHGYKRDVAIAFGTAQEWIIKAAPRIDDQNLNNHPFHLHVNPFQVVMYTDPSGKSKPMNVWRDTLLIKGGESYTIRTRFEDFKGRTVLHCHILDHEDQGMMAPLNITDGPGVDAGIGANLRPVSVPAPALKLPDPSGVLHDLAEFRRNVVLVFIQGMECSHCLEQLRDLVRVARQPISPDTEVVAVSSRPVLNPRRALQALGVTASDKFLLLVDENHGVFRDFGCFKGGPLHGLFLIDRTGMIRSQYVGETPFSDAELIMTRIRQFASNTGARSKT